MRRSTRTIKRWRLNGMPMGWENRNGQQMRVVDQDVLQAWFRERLDNWPTHQWRMRRKAAELAAEDD